MFLIWQIACVQLFACIQLAFSVQPISQFCIVLWLQCVLVDVVMWNSTDDEIFLMIISKPVCSCISELFYWYLIHLPVLQDLSLSGLTIVCHVPTHSLRDKLYYPVLRRERKNTHVCLHLVEFKKCYGTLEVMIYSFCAWFCLHSLWQSEGSHTLILSFSYSHTLVLFACLLISFPLPLADKKGGLSAMYASPDIRFFPPLCSL